MSPFSVMQPRDILSITDFKRNTTKYLKRLRQSGRPGVLTVNGRAEAVVMDLGAYRKLVEAIDTAEAVTAIQQSLNEFEEGRGMPAVEALRKLQRRKSE